MRDELSQYSLSCGLNDLSLENDDAINISDIVTRAIVNIVDCAMYTLNENKDAYDSCHSTLELVCAVACSDKQLATAIVNRAIDYITVPKDTLRVEACDMLGWCMGQVLAAPASILKGKKSKISMEEWKVECAVGGGKALLMRLTDKITKVRGAAIMACSFFFKSSQNEELIEIASQLEEGLVWLASNDTSATNRALAVSFLPVTEDNIASIVVRLKDVDVKVREAALEALRKKVSLNDLGEEVMVEILRSGLTKRYAAVIGSLFCCKFCVA